MSIFLKTAKILKNPRQGTIVGLFLLLLVALFFFFWAYYSAHYKKSLPEPYSRILGLMDEQHPNYYYEQGRVYSYNGQVKEVKNDYLLFEATYFKDRAIVQSVFKAHLSPVTDFVKKDLYKLYKFGPENTELAFEPAGWQDLKRGSQIQVFSNQDIKRELEFPASRVEIIYQSQEF